MPRSTAAQGTRIVLSTVCGKSSTKTTAREMAWMHPPGCVFVSSFVSYQLFILKLNP